MPPPAATVEDPDRRAARRLVAVRSAPADRRARLTAGLADAIAEKGYAAATIADVVRHARVSKRTFYEHFADKEACFLALYSESSDELLALIARRGGRRRARGTRALERRRRAPTSSGSPPSRR